MVRPVRDDRPAFDCLRYDNTQLRDRSYQRDEKVLMEREAFEVVDLRDKNKIT